MRLGILALMIVASLGTAGLAGCAREAPTPRSSTSPPLSAEASPALPAPLTSAGPDKLPWASPNMMTREESRRRFILLSRRHETLGQAAKAAGFTPRLPDYPGLQYLMTKPPDSSLMVFSASYQDGKLWIAEWQGGPSLLGEPGDMYSVTGKLRDQDASVITTMSGGRRDERIELSDLVWSEDGINFHMWYQGPRDEAVKIAESIPRR